jgi:hypothetical protein
VRLFAHFNDRMQAYHIKEISNFSKDALSAAAKILEPVSRVPERARPSAGSAEALIQQNKPMPASVPTLTETRHQTTPLSSSSVHTNTSRGLEHRGARASITFAPTNLVTDLTALQDKEKFDFIFSWARIPEAPRMLNSQKTQLSAQAAALYRAIDKDGNGNLNSVEFFEGMISQYGLSQDHVLHIIKILKSQQQGFYSFEEFQKIFFAIQTNLTATEVSLQHQQPNLEPVDGDEDICVIFDSPTADDRHPNPTALTPKNAGTLARVHTFGHNFAFNVTLPSEALRGKLGVIHSTIRQRQKLSTAQ